MNQQSYTVIDVREPDEYAAGHVKGAVNVPLGRVVHGASELADVGKTANIVVYCRTGSRAGVAENVLKQHGFTNVTNGINQAEVERRFGL